LLLHTNIKSQNTKTDFTKPTAQN